MNEMNENEEYLLTAVFPNEVRSTGRLKIKQLPESKQDLVFNGRVLRCVSSSTFEILSDSHTRAHIHRQPSDPAVGAQLWIPGATSPDYSDPALLPRDHFPLDRSACCLPVQFSTIPM